MKVFASPLFQQKQFLRFWLARLFGLGANQMLLVAVAWQMYDITHSAWNLGLVGLFQFVPALLLTLPAGHAADRWRRGTILAVCLFVQAGVALVLIASTQTDSTSRDLILALSVVLGVCRAFQMPTQQALTPLLVPTELLEQAIALSSSGMQMGIIGGPALGGMLYAHSASLVYVVCAVLLLIAGITVFTLRYPHLATHSATTWSSVLAGVRFVWQRKILLAVISLDLFAVLLGGATALLPIYARDILHTGPQGLGLLRAAPAIGALLMSLLLLRLPIQRHVGTRMLLAVAWFGLATIVFGLTRHFALAMLALAVSGAADMVGMVIRQTLLQLETPDAIRGRVSAVNSIFIGASNQLGEFESGATAALFGPVASVVMGGAGAMLVAAAWVFVFPSLIRRQNMAPSDLSDAASHTPSAAPNAAP